MSEIFVVASKVKKLIKEQGEMNTSASAIEALSKKIENMAKEAILKAKADGRKTVMDRDIL